MEGARNERCHKWAHKYLKALKTYTKHTEKERKRQEGDSTANATEQRLNFIAVAS